MEFDESGQLGRISVDRIDEDKHNKRRKEKVNLHMHLLVDLRPESLQLSTTDYYTPSATNPTGTVESMRNYVHELTFYGKDGGQFEEGYPAKFKRGMPDRLGPLNAAQVGNRIHQVLQATLPSSLRPTIARSELPGADV